jgi:hypothetical protein
LLLFVEQGRCLSLSTGVGSCSRHGYLNLEPFWFNRNQIGLKPSLHLKGIKAWLVPASGIFPTRFKAFCPLPAGIDLEWSWQPA